MRLAEILIDMPMSKAFLVGVVVAGLYWLVGFDSGANWEAGAKNFNKEIVSVKKEQKGIQEQIARVKNFKENLKLKDEQFQKFTNYIPAKLTVSDMMRSISSEAKAAGVNIIGIKDSSRGQSLKSPFYEVVAVQVELEGSFPQHLLFLSFLTRLDKIITVEKIGFKGSNKKIQSDLASVRLNAVLVGYRYKGNTVAENKPRGRK